MGAKETAAETYARLREPLTLPYGLQTLNGLGIEAGERLLDVAGGTGGVALEAARRGAMVVAVDSSQGMAGYVEERARREGVNGVTAVVMDGQKLELPTESFDAACSVFGIMFFPDHWAGLAEMFRVLKPGGRVGVAVWQNPARMEHLAVWERAARTLAPDAAGFPRPNAWLQMETEDGLRRELEAVGFREVVVTPAAHPWEVASAQWFVENFDSSAAFSEQIGPGSRDRLRETVLAQLQAEHGEGAFALTAHAHIGIAVR